MQAAAAEEYLMGDFSSLSQERLLSMKRAGEEINECYRVLNKAGLNIVGEILRGSGTFYEMNHYPEGDVYDRETHSQYYYHAHRGDHPEHGHFHTFQRAAGMPAAVKPVLNLGKEPWPAGEDALSHLIAISMDSYGYPVSLFATNRWVTGETWYASRDVVSMLDHFAIDHASPSWPVNRWLGAMVQLFYPQIEILLHQRDDVVDTWSNSRPDIDVFEDRDLEVTGDWPISMNDQIERVNAALDALELRKK